MDKKKVSYRIYDRGKTLDKGGKDLLGSICRLCPRES